MVSQGHGRYGSMPKAAPRPCTHPGCRAYAVKDGRCKDHPHISGWVRYSDKAGSAHSRGYGASWRKLRNRILVRDTHLCQLCLKRGMYIQAREVDHITPKAVGGTDSDDNLMAICKDCHKVKTLQEAAQGRGEGKK